MAALEALDQSPVWPGSAGAAARGAADAMSADAAPAEPTASATEIVVAAFEARAELDRAAAQRGYSFNATRTRDAFARLVRAMVAKRGRVTPAELWDLAAALYGAPVAFDGGIGVARGPFTLMRAPLRDAGELADELLGRARPENVPAWGKLVPAEAEATGRAVVVMQARRNGYVAAAARWASRVKQAEAGLPRPPTEGRPSSAGLSAYLAHAKAAEAAGFKWREAMFEGKDSPAERWMRALAADADGRGKTLAEEVGADRLPRLVRAYEVLNGIGGQGAAEARRIVWDAVYPESLTERQKSSGVAGTHHTAQMMRFREPLEMGPTEARRIVDAWETGSDAKIDAALGVSSARDDAGTGHAFEAGDAEAVDAGDADWTGLRGRMRELLDRQPAIARSLSDVAGGGTAGGERVHGARVTEEWGLQPDGYVADDPAAMAEARDLVDGTPRPLLLAAEAAAMARRARDLAKRADPDRAAKGLELAAVQTERAKDLLAYQWARVEALEANEAGSDYGMNGRRGDLAVEFLLSELGESAATGRAGNHVVDAVHQLKRLLFLEAHENGWVVEQSDGTATESPEFLRRVREIREALKPELEAQRRRPEPFADEGQDPLAWLCGSPCRISSVDMADEALKEAEAKGGISARLHAVHRNLKKALSQRRSVLMSYALTYARQWRDPAVRSYVNSFARRWFASLRDRFGETLATPLGKANDLYHSLTAEHTAKWLETFREAGYKISADLTERPSFEKATAAEQREIAEQALIARALEGTYDPAKLPARAFKAFSAAGPLFDAARRQAAQHIFRHVSNDAAAAQREGRNVSRAVLRPHRRTFGDVVDPAAVLDIVRSTWELRPGQTREAHGRLLRGWGLRQYFPHMFGPTQSREIGVGDELVKVAWLDGETVERWRAAAVEDYARRHGFISSRRRMKALLERTENADGWIEDALWAGTSYMEQLARKISHERAMDDLVPLVFGDWTPIRTSSAEELARELGNVTPERSDGAFGSVDPYFGVQLTGSVANAGVRVNMRGKWIRPERSELGQETRDMLALSWKTGQWRLNRAFTKIDATLPPEKWRLALSDGRTTLILRGKRAIEAAGVQRRDRGLIGYRDGEQYAAIKETIRKATGYDVDSGRLDPGSLPGRFAARLSDFGQGVGRLLYHSQLGGVVNPKAWMVQTIDGFLQNYAGVGGKETLEALPDFGGFEAFWSKVTTASNPQLAYEQALKDDAASPYVRLVRPILDASGMKLNEALKTERQMRPTTPAEAALGRLDRTSFLSFSLADIRAKEMAYYAAFRKFVDAGQVVDPETGAATRIVAEALPLGELFRYGRDVVSAHDLARGVMERGHFTQARWAMPGVVQMPGWPVMGHLGTVSTNVAAQFWRGAADAVRYATTGDQQYEYSAMRAGRYLVGLGVAYWIARLLGRDYGEYVGPRPADIGYGETRLGKALPFLHALPDWVRVPALQYPDERTLPVKLLLSEKPEEGLPAMLGDAVIRAASGEDAGTALKDAWSPWWSTWSRTIGMGPWTRSGRPLVAALTSQRSDLDPDRPWQIRDPSWFGPDGKTRYRSTFDAFFGDVLLPGWSLEDSAAHQRIAWAKMKAGVRGRTRATLGKDLRSPDPERRAAAAREMIERGYEVETWRQRKQGIMEQLPSDVRRGLGAGSTAAKLEIFAESASAWPPAIRRLALRYILPETQGATPSGVDAALWSQVSEALNAPWKE